MDTIQICLHKRGPRRLGYMFVSRRLLDHIEKCGYEKFDARIVSDHQAYYADFSLKGLFDRQLPKLLSNMLRGIKGNSPVNITKYIKFLFKYIGDHNIIRKAKELAYSANFDEAKANKLDQVITEGMFAAEKECRQTYRLPWDKATYYAVTKLNILRCMISEERNEIDNKEVIEAKIKSLNDPEFERPASYDDLIKEHRRTRAAVRELVKNKRSYNTATQQEREKAFIKAHEEVMNTKRARQIF